MKKRHEDSTVYIWDTAGQERYSSSLSKAFYRQKDGIIIAYIIDDRSTLKWSWLKDIQAL